VRVRLTMVAPARRYHVALVDPLPGASRRSIRPGRDRHGAAGARGHAGGAGAATAAVLAVGAWYQHQNLRDERAEAFTPLLWDGVHTYSYVARATTPGTSCAAPKAEEMYMPRRSAGGAGDRVIVE